MQLFCYEQQHRTEYRALLYIINFDESACVCGAQPPCPPCSTRLLCSQGMFSKRKCLRFANNVCQYLQNENIYTTFISKSILLPTISRKIVFSYSVWLFFSLLKINTTSLCYFPPHSICKFCRQFRIQKEKLSDKCLIFNI